MRIEVQQRDEEMGRKGKEMEYEQCLYLSTLHYLYSPSEEVVLSKSTGLVGVAAAVLEAV
jgi:hypothetical protein